MTPAIERMLKHRLILLTGDEEVLRRRALEDLLEGAGLEKDDFDLQVLYGDAASPTEWVGSAGTAPFLAARRAVVVRHLLRRDPEDALNGGLDQLPESALLILVADEESADKASKYATGWQKLVTNAKGHVERFQADPKKAKESLKLEIDRAGKKISPAALDAFVEMTGASLSRATEELDKLLLYVGETEQIREADVRSVVVPSRDWNVFNLVDAIAGGRVGEALNQLRILVGSGAKAEEAAFRNILPITARYLRLLWQARICVEAGCTPSNAPESILALFPEKPNLAKEQPYRQGPLMQAARRLDLDQLQRCFQILSDTDARLKGILSGFSAMETLERMVLEMVEALAPVPARPGRR